MRLRRTPDISEAIDFAHTRGAQEDEQVHYFAHACDGEEFKVAGFCQGCDLPLEPADRLPVEPHGWVRCRSCEEVVVACPLGCWTDAELEDRCVRVPLAAT